MNIGIIGVGLIGGSFALAVRRGRSDVRVIGIDRNAAALDTALHMRVIDEAAMPSATADCDVVMLAVPVRQIRSVLAEIAPTLHHRTVITDAGSTKTDVISAAREVLGDNVAQFVPGHPIAGREHSGVAASDPALFDGKNAVITPIAENTADSIGRIRALWRVCGANVVEMSAESHDAVFAAVSHLPHLLAFALVDELAARPNAKSLFSFAASGFRDFTRIAGSNPEMWRDIALNNRGALLLELSAYEARIAELRIALASGNGEAIAAMMERAKHARESWMAGELDSFRDEAT